MPNTAADSTVLDVHAGIDEEVMGGTPVIPGTRMTVHAVLDGVEDGDTGAPHRCFPRCVGGFR